MFHHKTRAIQSTSSCKARLILPRHSFWGAILSALIIPQQAAGAEQQAQNFFAEQAAPTTKPETSILQLQPIKSGVAQSRNLLGQTAATIGFGLDSVFGSPDKNEPNESALIVSSGMRQTRDGSLTQVSGFTFRADLPATSSKFQLFVRLDDEKELQDDPDGSISATSAGESGAASSPSPSNSTQSVIQADKAGLFFRYIYQSPNSPWQTSFDTGWQLDTSNWDTEAVSYLRTGRNYQIADWVVRPTPVIFWTEDSGPGAGISLHTQTELDAITTLNSTTGAHYLIDETTTYYQHGWQLVKAFNQDLRATYNITFYTNDKANDLIDEAKISATLRRRIDGDWLFFSVTPADTLIADNDYTSDLSITFQLEAKFGTQY